MGKAALYFRLERVQAYDLDDAKVKLAFLGPLAHVLVDETRVSMRPGACGMTWPLFQLPL